MDNYLIITNKYDAWADSTMTLIDREDGEIEICVHGSSSIHLNRNQIATLREWLDMLPDREAE